MPRPLSIAPSIPLVLKQRLLELVRLANQEGLSQLFAHEPRLKTPNPGSRWVAPVPIR